MLRLFRERDEVSVVEDQWGSPTLAGDLADIILHIVTYEKPQYGIFNFTNEGRTNWFEFAALILELARKYHLVDREVQLIPIKTNQYPTKALRPANSYLSKEKVKEVYNVSIRPWQEALESFMSDLAVHKGKK
jgi:dTDP-4-dehydrorhamnose reductase